MREIRKNQGQQSWADYSWADYQKLLRREDYKAFFDCVCSIFEKRSPQSSSQVSFLSTWSLKRRIKKVLSEVKEELEKIQSSKPGEQIGFVGSGGFNFVFSIGEETVYKLQHDSLEFPRGRHSNIYSSDLDKPGRAVQLFNEMLEAWKERNPGKQIKQATLPPLDLGLNGYYMPRADPLKDFKKKNFYLVLKSVLSYYKATGRILLDSYIMGNIAQNQLITDLGLSIFMGTLRHGIGPATSEQFKRSVSRLTGGLLDPLLFYVLNSERNRQKGMDKIEQKERKLKQPGLNSDQLIEITTKKQIITDQHTIVIMLKCVITLCKQGKSLSEIYDSLNPFIEEMERQEDKERWKYKKEQEEEEEEKYEEQQKYKGGSAENEEMDNAYKISEWRQEQWCNKLEELNSTSPQDPLQGKKGFVPDQDELGLYFKFLREQQQLLSKNDHPTLRRINDEIKNKLNNLIQQIEFSYGAHYDNGAQKSGESFDVLLVLLRWSISSAAQYAEYHREQKNSLRSFFSAHGLGGQTDIRRYVLNILECSDNLLKQLNSVEPSGISLKQLNSVEPSDISSWFEKETLSLFQGGRNKGYQSSTTEAKKSSKIQFFKNDQDLLNYQFEQRDTKKTGDYINYPAYCSARYQFESKESRWSVKRGAHSKRALLLTAVLTMTLVLLCANFATGGVLSPAFLILAPIIKSYASIAVTATAYCTLPIAGLTVMKGRRASIKEASLIKGGKDDEENNSGCVSDSLYLP